MTTVRNQYCPNKACQFYGRKLCGNVVVHGRAYERFKCKACGKTWAASRCNGTYGLRSELWKLCSAQKMLEQGVSVRQVAEKVSVSPSTVQRWKFREVCLFNF